MPQTKVRIEGIQNLERRSPYVRDLDRGIENLVKVLNYMGISTYASCEGHMRSDRFHHPWVALSRSFFYHEANQTALRPVLEAFNECSDVKWILDGEELRPDHEASRLRELRRMQESADVLALYMYENIYKPIASTLRKTPLVPYILKIDGS